MAQHFKAGEISEKEQVVATKVEALKVYLSAILYYFIAIL